MTAFNNLPSPVRMKPFALLFTLCLLLTTVIQQFSKVPV